MTKILSDYGIIHIDKIKKYIKKSDSQLKIESKEQDIHVHK